MRSRWRVVVALVPAFAGALLLACGGDDSAGSSSGGGNSDGGADVYNPPPQDAAVIGKTNGVVLLHGASFPPFRVCFENYPTLPPQPDSTLMPESNLVGVAVGSLARIAPLAQAPGKVWVFDQRKLADTPQTASARTCGEILADKSFIRELAYELAGDLGSPLGVNSVDVLAITGCGNSALLASVGMTQEGCTGWDETTGSLRTRVVSLQPTIQATTGSVPVQLVHMAERLEAARPDGGSLDVVFGKLAGDAGDAGQTVPVPSLYQVGAERVLQLDQTTASVFGTYGFTIAVRGAATPDAGTAPIFAVTESLAAVQDLSAPQILPTSYYLSPSNYALLLVGDPRLQRGFDDGGANPAYDARRAVHLLAVPVKPPGDAGAAR